jgi:PAS domain S-box-containing protein
MSDATPQGETQQEARKHPRSAQSIGASEEWLFTALQSIGDAVIATDADGRVVFMNLVAVQLTGWSEEAAQGTECRTVFHIVNEATREEAESPVTKVLRDGVISGLANHTILLSRDGSEHFIDDSGSPIRNKDGNLIGVVLIFRDITEKRKSEQTRQEQLEILQTLFDHIPVIVTFLDPDQNFKWVNREWIKVVGWSLEELAVPGCATHVAPLFAPWAGWHDYALIVKDGSSLDLAWATVRLSDGSSIGIGQDITLRKQNEAHLADRTTQIERDNRRMQQSLHETDHRVKNNLQLIVSLLDMQTQEGQGAVPLQKLIQLRTHIQTVSAIHSLLVDSKHESAGESSTVSAKDALESLLPMLQQLVGERRIVWSVEDVQLPIKQGLSLAVLINELVSNAVKHGGQQVDLRLEVQDDTVTLEVKDDGPGFVLPFDPFTQSHFGLELVESVGQIDLGGKTTYENRPEGGACVRLTFPRATLVSPSLYA